MKTDFQSCIEQIEHICLLIEDKNEYAGELTEFLPVLNQVLSALLAMAESPEDPFQINEQYVLQVLNDLMYGIEHGDAVILLDVLRYGLLPVFYYSVEELQGRGQDE